MLFIARILISVAIVDMGALVLRVNGLPVCAFHSGKFSTQWSHWLEQCPTAISAAPCE